MNEGTESDKPVSPLAGSGAPFCCADRAAGKQQSGAEDSPQTSAVAPGKAKAALRYAIELLDNQASSLLFLAAEEIPFMAADRIDDIIAGAVRSLKAARVLGAMLPKPDIGAAGATQRYPTDDSAKQNRHAL